jgi:1-deoxy-D-xylulose-5-phosphate reductoisomerase
VLNGAKEVALEAFIAGKLSFLAMAQITEAVMDRLAGMPSATSMDDVFAADKEARQRAAGLID